MFAAAASPRAFSRRRRILLLAIVALAIPLTWLAIWLSERRQILRLRLELERLGGDVQVEEGGPPWLYWLIDRRYFDRVVELELSGFGGFDMSWIAHLGNELQTLALLDVRLNDSDLAGLKNFHDLRELNL